MSNWPQISASVATMEFEIIRSSMDLPTPRSRHPDRIYSPVGAHISDDAIQELIETLTALAIDHGYPGKSSDRQRITFDRNAARILSERMDISWADAGNRRLWSFMSLVALPHLTCWRFGTDNRERWIATDLTRHTWSRLWWQAVVFEGHEDLLDELSESDLNALLERRTIGGDPRLARTLAQTIVTTPDDVPRRRVLRDVTKRLRRLLAFTDVRALDDSHVEDLCSTAVAESLTQLHAAAGGD